MLDEMSRDVTSDDCKHVFDSAKDYQIWPDAKKGELVALATDLPHVIQGCAEEISLTLDQARKLGFSERLLTAIDQAHRAQTAASQTGRN
jgi:hypothetical protein